MGFSLVAHTKAQGTANGVTSPAINTTGATLLAIFLASFEGDPPPVISDSLGNQWSQAQIEFETNARGTWYFCPNPTVGANHTFSANGASSFPAIDVSAWSGPQVAVLDAFSGSSSASFVTSAQPGSVTPTAAGELCLFGVACGHSGAPSAPSVDSGFTLLDSLADTASSAGIAAAYLVQATAAGINPTLSWTVSSDQACAIACFKAVATGGGAGTPPPQPALAIVDKGDGTGATATISGGDAGAANAVYVAPLPSGTGNVNYTQQASINGNAAGGLALSPGFYLAYAEATENSLFSLPSNTVYFRTTAAGGARTVSPTGHFSTALDGVAYLIASSANFQSLVGAANAAAALASVKVESDDTEESGSTRPRAIVYPAIGGFSLHKVSLQNFRPEIALYVSFEIPPAGALETETNRESRLWDENLAFLNTIEAILDDCANNQGLGTGHVAGQSQVALSRIELLDGPSAIEEIRAEGEAGEVSSYFYGITFCFHIHG